MKVVISGFLNTLTKRQKVFGFIYLPLHFFVLPLLLSMLAYYVPGGMDELTVNILYMGLGFIFCLTAMNGFLRTSFDVMLDNKAKTFFGVVSSALIHYLLTYAAAVVMQLILGESITNPNNEAVAEMAEAQGLGPAIGLAVFIAPVVEEVLFRGVLFGTLREKSRVLAYLVSIAVFSFFHVWQFLLLSLDPLTLVYMIEYVPAGYALARCYEQTNSIWGPVFLHMGINVVGMATLA